MSAQRERSGLRFAGAVLCGSASLLLLVSSVHLYAGEEGALASLTPLLAGAGLLLASVRSLRP